MNDCNRLQIDIDLQILFYSVGEPCLLIIKVDKRMPFEGYKNKEEATKRKILHDVFKSGDAYVNSGDLFYSDADHYYYFYDRTGDTFRFVRLISQQ